MPVYALEINEDVFAPAKFTSFASLLNVVIPTLLLVAAFAFLVMFFWAGTRLLTAGGNKEAVDMAKKTITYAVFGLAIIFLSYLAIQLMTYIFNIQVPGL